MNHPGGGEYPSEEEPIQLFHDDGRRHLHLLITKTREGYGADR